MFRDRIAGRDALLVLDNAADEAQVADLIPADPRCLVLITSRRNLAGLDGARLFRLDVFPLRDALELLARILGGPRLDAEPEAAQEVVRLCGLLPLAVSLAAARLRSRPSWSLERLAAYLRDSGLDAVRAGGRELRPVFDLSYRDLPPATARAFRLLSLHPGRGFTGGAVAALTGTPEGAARGALEALVDENLVEQRTADRYELHDLLHAYALERPRPTRARRSGRRRWRGLCRGICTRPRASRRRWRSGGCWRPCRRGPASRRRRPSTRRWRRWPGTTPNARTSARSWPCAADAGWHELALRLPVTLLGCYQLRTDWPHWRAAYETGLASARAIGDRAAEGRL